MSSRFLVPLIVVSLGLAAIAAPPAGKYESAVRAHYPSATAAEVLDTQRVNGVAVQNIRVTTPQGQSILRVTEFGDVITRSLPNLSGQLPTPVRRSIDGLFKQPPQDVTVYYLTRYFADATTAGKPHRFDLTATGQLHDIRSGAEMKAENVSLQRVEGKEGRDAADRILRQVGSQGKIDVVYRDRENEGFYFVELTRQDNSHERIFADTHGTVLSVTNEIPRGQVPEPIIRTLEHGFNVGTDATFWRQRFLFVEFTHPLPGGDRLAFRVDATGNVMRIDDLERNAPASPAGLRTAP